MSGFSPEWLALREPFDLAARSNEVLEACRKAFADRPAITVCDLGAGAGASVHAFADMLPRNQTWTLVDHAPENLAAVRVPASPHITVQTRTHDFARDPACWPENTDLVTASALLDLASEDWIVRLVAALARKKTPLLATLTFDGAITAEPKHPLDVVVASAFRAHQGHDKGFGPAAGPRAADILEQHLREAGYTVASGDSPWRITASSEEFMRRNLEGIARAARETGLSSADEWLNARLADTRLLVIGHRDVFAV